MSWGEWIWSNYFTITGVAAHVGIVGYGLWIGALRLWDYIRWNWVGTFNVKPIYARKTWFLRYQRPTGKSDKALFFKAPWSRTVFFIRLETRETSAKRR